MPATRKGWRKQLRRSLRDLILGYMALCLLLFVFQRHLEYLPHHGPTEPAAIGLNDYEPRTFQSADGLSIPYWYHAGNAKAPVILYFHGNGGGLYVFGPPLRYFAEHGYRVYAMEYRGYPGAPGSPNQPDIVADAIALSDLATHESPGQKMIIWGYSLGSGVGSQLAAARPPAAMVLEGAFSSTEAVAKARFPFLPVGWLMHDTYHSDIALKNLHMPLFMMHGEEDGIVPIRFGEELYAAANEPKEFHRYAGAHHLDLMATSGFDEATAFIQRVTAQKASRF